MPSHEQEPETNTSSSAAQPASSAGIAEPTEAPSLAIPSAETPLYEALLEKLARTNDENIMEDLANFTLFGKLQAQAPFGSAEQPADIPLPYLLGLRIENLLSVTNKRRQKHIEKLAARNDPRSRMGEGLVFSDADLQEAINDWRNEPGTWMRPENLEKLSGMTRQKQHQYCKSRFATMLFQLFGSHSLAETFLKFPICNAAQPALILQAWATAWQTYQNTPEHAQARRDSQPKQEPRISKQIHGLRQRLAHGKWVGDWVDADLVANWYSLSPADQRVYLEYQRGDIQRQIEELQNQQQPKFEGATSFMLRTNAELNNLL